MANEANNFAQTVLAMRPVLPARDFEVSKRFYMDLGFCPQPLTEKLVEMHLGSQSFILQAYYIHEWADNFVMHLRVSDVARWWDHIVAIGLATRYGVKTRAPQLEDWGLVASLVDPSGVLWRIAEKRTKKMPSSEPGSAL